MHHHALSVVNVCRYKVLAQQYKAMYPTLEIDIKGELAKLKVGTNCLKNTLYLCLYNNISHVFRTMWRGSSQWSEMVYTTCMKLYMVLQRRSWWRAPMRHY